MRGQNLFRRLFLAAIVTLGVSRGLCHAGRGAVLATRAEAGRHRRSWNRLPRLSVALSADGNTAIVGGPDDNGHRGGVGLHSQRRRLDPARRQAGRHGRSWTRLSKAVRRAVGRRQHRHRGRACDNGTPGRRGSSLAAAASGPSKATSWSAPARLETPPARQLGRAVGRRQHRHRGRVRRQRSTGAAWVFTRSGGVWTQQGSKLVGTGAVGHTPTKASQSRCPPTATPPSWAGLTTTGRSGRRGSSLAAAASGPSKAASWSAPAQLETAVIKGCQSRCRPTAIPPSWAGLTTTGAPGRRGCSLAAAASGPSKAASWSAPARLEGLNKASPSRCRPTATPPSWVGSTTTVRNGAAWVFTRSGGVWTQQGSKLVGTGAVGTPNKASQSRCRPTATQPSWAGGSTTGESGRRGSFSSPRR